MGSWCSRSAGIRFQLRIQEFRVDPGFPQSLVLEGTGLPQQTQDGEEDRRHDQPIERGEFRMMAFIVRRKALFGRRSSSSTPLLLEPEPIDFLPKKDESTRNPGFQASELCDPAILPLLPEATQTVLQSSCGLQHPFALLLVCEARFQQLQSVSEFRITPMSGAATIRFLQLDEQRQSHCHWVAVLPELDQDLSHRSFQVWILSHTEETEELWNELGPGASWNRDQPLRQPPPRVVGCARLLFFRRTK